MNNMPITILDMECIDNENITNTNSTKRSDNNINIKLNPNKRLTMSIINEIYESNEICNESSSTCPCNNLLIHGICKKGLFINK